MPSQSPPPSEPPFHRFAALVRRELGADDVRILEADAPRSPAPNVLHATLPDGRLLAVTFAGTPESPPALLRRLEILVRTFPLALQEEPEDHRPARPAVTSSLHEELRALATRASAVDAVVLDAHSPVVWGSATQRNSHALEAPTPELQAALELLHMSRLEVLEQITEEQDANAPESGDLPESGPPEAMESAPVLRDTGEPPELTSAVSLRAIREVLALPGIPQMRKGKPLHHAVRDPDFGYIAQSFAAIYLVVLVFDAPFDELRAERAVNDALPRIERLVLALPPLDPAPSPTANVISMRRRARR